MQSSEECLCEITSPLMDESITTTGVLRLVYFQEPLVNRLRLDFKVCIMSFKSAFVWFSSKSVRRNRVLINNLKVVIQNKSHKNSPSKRYDL